LPELNPTYELRHFSSKAKVLLRETPLRDRVLVCNDDKPRRNRVF
jgi:hypothetical protein